jgi:hypothetical protein
MREIGQWCILMLTILTLPLIMACSRDDDDNDNSDKISVVGHWEGDYYQFYESGDLKNMIEDGHVDYPYKFILFEDGTCGEYSGVHHGSEGCCTYKQLNREIYITWPLSYWNTDSYYIVEYTRNTMTLKYMTHTGSGWLVIYVKRVD